MAMGWNPKLSIALCIVIFMNQVEIKAIKICKRSKEPIAELLIKNRLVKARFNKFSKNGIEVAITASGKIAFEYLESLII